MDQFRAKVVLACKLPRAIDLATSDYPYNLKFSRWRTVTQTSTSTLTSSSDTSQKGFDPLHWTSQLALTIASHTFYYYHYNTGPAVSSSLVL